MYKGKTIHFCALDKFIPPFIDFVSENIDNKNQVYFLFGDIKAYPVPLSKSVIHMHGIISWIELFIAANCAKKIVLHSLLRKKYVIFLFLQPWLLQKTYWIMWGADLYHYLKEKKTIKAKIYEFIRKYIIKRFGFIVTGTPGDVVLARKWYQAKGQWVKCFNYPTNIIDPKTHPFISRGKNELTTIMVGNSADPANNHAAAFSKIKSISKQRVKIICPIAYGKKKYAETIKLYGYELFGEDIIFLEKLLPYNEYLDLIAGVDIVIFNHSRQQGLGNLIALLGMGKKVFVKRTSLFDLFCDVGIKIFEVDEMNNLNKMDDEEALSNRDIIIRNFSKDKLIESLSSWIL